MHRNSKGQEKTDLDLMNAQQLKAVCKQYGLKMSGKKSDLQERIRDHLTGNDAPESKDSSAGGGVSEFDGKTVAQLKEMCKEHGLKVSGKKADLQDRLREHFVANGLIKDGDGGDEFEAMSDSDLADALVARGLSGKGSREQLLARLRSDIEVVSAMKASVPDDRDACITLSDALEAAAKVDGSELSEILAEVRAKATAEPKHVDVTIRSLGLNPIKYTTGGAPSVTAAVLRDLAGDPLAEKPRYGLVSLVVFHSTV